MAYTRDATIPQGYEAVPGKTYPVKEALKRLGGRWGPQSKVWWVPAEKLDAALRIVRMGPAALPPELQVDGAEAGTFTAAKDTRLRLLCWVCGRPFPEGVGDFQTYYCGCGDADF